MVQEGQLVKKLNNYLVIYRDLEIPQNTSHQRVRNVKKLSSALNFTDLDPIRKNKFRNMYQIVSKVSHLQQLFS